MKLKLIVNKNFKKTSSFEAIVNRHGLSIYDVLEQKLTDGYEKSFEEILNKEAYKKRMVGYYEK